MAWGCFCWIPCPYKKWNEDDRPAMLAMLPLVGTFIGAITGLVWWAMILMGTGQLLIGAVVTAAYLLLTGFIHLDGYMDCCDAVLPRHPDMERRREILKDPHTGAFGAIGLVLMVVIFMASVGDITDREFLHPVILMSVVATVSRTAAVIEVLNRKPMDTSQYTEMSSKKPGKRYWVIPIIIAGIVFEAGDWIMKMTTDIVVEGEFVSFSIPEVIGLGVVVFVTLIAALLTGAWDRRVLGGMNGDISGHMIVTGEMFGMLAAALVV